MGCFGKEHVLRQLTEWPAGSSVDTDILGSLRFKNSGSHDSSLSPSELRGG